MNSLGKAFGTNVPDHVANRLAALTAGAPIKLVTGLITHDETGLRSGEVVVFTEDLVASATLAGSDFPNQLSDDESARSVTAAVWNRRDLVSISLAGEANIDAYWNWSDGAWPRDFQLGLTYSNGAHVTVVQSLSLSPAQQAEVADFVPSLLTDLRASI